MRLSHNLASLNIYREHTKNIKGQSITSHRISSGYKINSAKDDPNAIAQSERQRIQIRGLQMAARNSQDGVSMLQTAEGGMDTITNMLHRIKELSVQAGGANSESDKEIIQGEIKQLIEGIDDTARNTEFNGNKLLSEKTVTNNEEPGKYLSMPSGANVGENIEIPMFNLTSEVLGGAGSTEKLKNLDIRVKGGIEKALNITEAALQSVVSARSKYGALENRFDRTYEITTVVGDNIQRAESDVRDADVAEEMMAYAKYNILIEAGNAMMVQSNNFPKDILRILENVRK
jgi:flagellin